SCDQHLHVEAGRTFGDGLADPPGADDAQRLAVDRAAEQPARVPRVPGAVGAGGGRLHEPARGGQHRGERAGGGGDIDVVVPDGVVGDRLEVRGAVDQRGVDTVRDRGEQAVDVLDVLCE